MAGLPTLGLPHGALKKRTSHVLMKRTCRVSTTGKLLGLKMGRRAAGGMGSAVSRKLLKTKNRRALVHPIVGAGGWFFFALVDVDLEALACAPMLPVSDRVADVV